MEGNFEKYVNQATQYIDTSKLKKWNINPRTISQESLEILKQKITKYPEFFFARPILANCVDDNHLIVFAGNQRLEAALQLGLKKVPVIIFNNLPDNVQKEMAIIDNHNDGQWDMPKLKMHFSTVNFPKLGLNINFEPVKIKVPTIDISQTTNNDTEEIKHEQVGYPVNNAPALEESEEDVKLKHKCPRCGCEFED